MAFRDRPESPMSGARRYRAGASVEDYCRACGTDRLHTIIVVDDAGLPLRVTCGYCESQHNYRGGPRIQTSAVGPPRGEPGTSGTGSAEVARPRPATPPTVLEHERSTPVMSLPGHAEDLEVLLRRVIREEAGVSPVVPASKWRGGQLVLKPGTSGLQEKVWPIDAFFHKVVMVRNRLRTLEQQVNASDLPDDVKVKLQAYVSGCYGSLTSFNVLFADEDDHFRGTGE
jgi:hypothetical protein